MKYLGLSLLFSALIFSNLFSQEINLPSVIKPGTQLEKLSGEFSFTEGPTADAQGNVYFTDQPNDRIMIWTTSGELLTFMQPAGRANGMFFDKKGDLWVCADEKTELWRISPDKKVEVVLGKFNEKILNGPNDVWVAPDGSLYFSDPYFRRRWWSHTDMPQDKQCVYYLSADRKVLKRVVEDMVQPNGIVGTADGKTIFIADMGGKKTYKYTIGPGGELTGKTLFCELGSDGMALDKKGNLYLTGSGVTVFDKNGNKLGNIPVPEGWTSNVCFGGKNRKTLYITASKGLYRIPTTMKGVW